MNGTLHKISFLKLQGGGVEAPITPRGRMGVDDMDHTLRCQINEWTRLAVAMFSS